MKFGEIYIGTSGWHYRHWIGTFYPSTTKANKQFDFYKQVFNTVEINNSFYRLPSPETFKAWYQESPENFSFCVKASRYITHMKKLKEPKDTTRRFFENVRSLKEKLGPILFQLPPSWKVNSDRFKEFLDSLPDRYRYVFEFRNSTWYSEEIFDLLRNHNCAFCIYELAGHQSPTNITADFVYVRLHGPGDKYQGSYSHDQLSDWAEQCKDWQHQGLNVFIYFDNDQNGYAALNARLLKELVQA
jgi:uncharacterized protein YecE (DUF72 family)